MRNICAIVYTSNTGYTAKYAALLSEAIHLPHYTLEEAENALPHGACVFYMGWLMAGKIKGFTGAKNKFRVLGTAAVGLSPEYDNADLKNFNGGDDAPIFYLQGGYDKSQLHGFYRIAMGIMEQTLIAKAKKDPSVKPRLALLQEGIDAVKPENLAEIIGWIG